MVLSDRCEGKNWGHSVTDRISGLAETSQRTLMTIPIRSLIINPSDILNLNMICNVHKMYVCMQYVGVMSSWYTRTKFSGNRCFHLQGSQEVLPKLCCLPNEINCVTLQKIAYLVLPWQPKISHYRFLNLSTLFFEAFLLIFSCILPYYTVASTPISSPSVLPYIFACSAHSTKKTTAVETVSQT
jgi:hypothetical protein